MGRVRSRQATSFLAVLALARHEVRQLAGAFASRATQVGIVAAVVVLAAAWPAIQERGVHPDAGLYPIEADAGAALAPAAAADGRFRWAGPGEHAVLRLHGEAYTPDGTTAGRAAAQALREAVLSWQEDELARERDQAAAFPVAVDLVFQQRDLAAAPDGGGGAPGPGGSGGEGDPGSTPPILDQTNATGRQEVGLRPADVQPPFPVKSLLLTFAYLIPLNFLAQLYAGSLLAERVRHRGLLVLTAPLSPAQVLVGRSLPYLAAGVVVYLAASLAIGVTGIGWLAALPIVTFVLAAALVLGNLARSPRELTFLLTGTTTLFSTFLFLPAVFTALPPLAFLSPVSVISAAIEGTDVALGLILYALVPLSLCVLGLLAIGIGLHREETLFSQQPLGAKVRQAVSRWTATPPRLVLAGVLAVPFALALELFVLALVIPLGLVAVFPAVVIGAAVLEESLKLLATASQARRPGWQAGLWVGVGFFAGEKLALLVALAGFGGLELGLPTLRLLGASGGLALLIGPLILHAVAAAVAGLGVARGRGRAVAWWAAAVGLHVAYNLAVLLIGGMA